MSCLLITLAKKLIQFLVVVVLANRLHLLLVFKQRDVVALFMLTVKYHVGS